MSRQRTQRRRSEVGLRDHEDFAGSLAPECHRAISDPKHKRAGLGPVLAQLTLGTQVETAFGEVAEERRILVDHPRNPESLAARKLRKWDTGWVGQ